MPRMQMRQMPMHTTRVQMHARMQMRLRLQKARIINIEIIGMRIAKGRKDKGLSQSQFAEMLNVTQQCVGKWERGDSLPDIFMLAKIGEIFGTRDICYFLGKDPCTCTCGCCDCCSKI